MEGQYMLTPFAGCLPMQTVGVHTEAQLGGRWLPGAEQSRCTW